MKRKKVWMPTKAKIVEIKKERAKLRDNYSFVYQFKISLKHIKPPIWRRIQVPDTYAFWDLHVAIQNAMGWIGGHLHSYTLIDHITKHRIIVGDPDDEFARDLKVVSEHKTKLSKWFSPGRKNAEYEYDFGDGWEHKITFEKMISREKDTKYPRCIAGARACPPEDCGGPGGYQEIIEGKCEFQENFEDYDPEHFNIGEIEFDDPDKYKDIADLF